LKQSNLVEIFWSYFVPSEIFKGVNDVIYKNLFYKIYFIKYSYMSSIGFILSSITFLELYIPLVIELNKRDIKSVFYIRTNIKSYANPMSNKNKKTLSLMTNRYNILIKKFTDIKNYTGIIVCVDGDIYGPHNINTNESLLIKSIVNDSHIKVSLIEYFNFYTTYNKYINYVDYVIFPNKIYAERYNFISSKNIFLGTPKYDINYEKDLVYNRYNLSNNRKYVVLFYPKIDKIKQKWGKNYIVYFNNLLEWLDELGYTVIIKTRFKFIDKIINQINKNILIVNDKDFYPETAIEILQIADLAICFSSTVIEEIVMSKTPFIEFIVCDVPRLDFLRDSSYSYQIIKNNLPNREEFIANIEKLMNNRENYNFDNIIDKYMFNKENVSKNIVDFLIKLNNTIII